MLMASCGCCPVDVPVVPNGTRVAYVGSLAHMHGLATVHSSYALDSADTRYCLLLNEGSPYGDTLTNVRSESIRLLTPIGESLMV
jgi:hypothetical protein